MFSSTTTFEPRLPQSKTPRVPPRRRMSSQEPRTPFAAVDGNRVLHSESKPRKRTFDASKTPTLKPFSSRVKKPKTTEKRRQSFGEDLYSDAKTPRISNRGAAKPSASKTQESRQMKLQSQRATPVKSKQADSDSSMDIDSDSDCSENCLQEQLTGMHRVSFGPVTKKVELGKRNHCGYEQVKIAEASRKKAPTGPRQMFSNEGLALTSSKTDRKQLLSASSRHQGIPTSMPIQKINRLSRSRRLSSTCTPPLEVGGNKTHQLEFSDDDLTIDSLQSDAGSVEALGPRCEDVYGPSWDNDYAMDDACSEEVEELPYRCEDIYGKIQRKKRPKARDHRHETLLEDDDVEELPEYCEDVYNNNPLHFPDSQVFVAPRKLHRTAYSPPATPDVWTLPEDDQSVNSKTFVFKMNGRSYKHPPLPPGWTLSVSKQIDRPFYSHPDYGTTLFCPVRLPVKYSRAAASASFFAPQIPHSRSNWFSSPHGESLSSGSSSQCLSEELPLTPLPKRKESRSAAFQSGSREDSMDDFDEASDASLLTEFVEVPMGLRLPRHTSQSRHQRLPTSKSHAVDASTLLTDKDVGSYGVEDDDMDLVSPSSEKLSQHNNSPGMQQRNDGDNDDMDLESSPASSQSSNVLVSSPHRDQDHVREKATTTSPSSEMMATRTATDDENRETKKRDDDINSGGVDAASSQGSTTKTTNIQAKSEEATHARSIKSDGKDTTTRSARNPNGAPVPVSIKTGSPRHGAGDEEDEDFPLVEDDMHSDDELDHDRLAKDSGLIQSEDEPVQEATLRSPESVHPASSKSPLDPSLSNAVSQSNQAKTTTGVESSAGTDHKSDETVARSPKDGATPTETCTVLIVKHRASQQRADVEALSKSMTRPSPDQSAASPDQLPNAVNLDETSFLNVDDDEVSAIASPASVARSTSQTGERRGSNQDQGSVSGESVEGASACLVDAVAYIPKGRTSVDPLQFVEMLPRNGRYKCRFPARPSALAFQEPPRPTCW